MNQYWISRFTPPAELATDVEARVHDCVVALPEAYKSQRHDAGDPFEFLLGTGAPVEADRENRCDMDPVDEGELCPLDESDADDRSAFANDVRLNQLMSGATVSDVVVARIPQAEESLLRAIAEGASRAAKLSSEVEQTSPRAATRVSLRYQANDNQQVFRVSHRQHSPYDDLYRQIDAYCDAIRATTDQLANREKLTVESFSDGLRAMRLVVTRFSELLNGVKEKVLDQTARIVGALSMDSYSALERTRRMADSVYFKDHTMSSVGHRSLLYCSYTVRLDMAGAACSVIAAGGEYCNSTGRLSFAPGECLRTVTVPLIDDFMGVETEERFGLALLTPTEGSCGVRVKHVVPYELRQHDSNAPLEPLKACLAPYRPLVHSLIHSKLVSTALVAGATENSTVVAKSKFDYVRTYKIRRFKDMKRHVVYWRFSELSENGTVVVVDGEPSFLPSAEGSYIVGTENVVRCSIGGDFFGPLKKG